MPGFVAIRPGSPDVPITADWRDTYVRMGYRIVDAPVTAELPTASPPPVAPSPRKRKAGRPKGSKSRRGTRKAG